MSLLYGAFTRVSMFPSMVCCATFGCHCSTSPNDDSYQGRGGGGAQGGTFALISISMRARFMCDIVREVSLFCIVLWGLKRVGLFPRA